MPLTLREIHETTNHSDSAIERFREKLRANDIPSFSDLLADAADAAKAAPRA